MDEVERFRSVSDSTKVDLVLELEDKVSDPRVLDLFVSVIGDADEYDLARIECVKILRLWPPDAAADRERVGRVIAAVLRTDEDEHVRQYAAQSLGPYADDHVVFEALSVALAQDDDINVRHNALWSVKEADRDDRRIALLRELVDDPELGSAAARTLREWETPGTIE